MPWIIVATCAWTDRPLQPMMKLVAMVLARRGLLALLAASQPMVISPCRAKVPAECFDQWIVAPNMAPAVFCIIAVMPATSIMRPRTEKIMIHPPINSMDVKESLTASPKS